MSETVTRYPLAWPHGYGRTPAVKRQKAAFGRREDTGHGYKQTLALTVHQAVGRIHGALGAFTRAGHSYRSVPEDAVISTNMKTRLDGLPASGQPEPPDPGAAVYFELDGKHIVLCCDKWNRVADNLAAIAATIDAMRLLERWGVSESERVFTGFAALPAPGEAKARTCWEVLGIEATQNRGAIDAAWRDRAKACHPDRPGGSHEAMAELNNARDQAHNSIPSSS